MLNKNKLLTKKLTKAVSFNDFCTKFNLQKINQHLLYSTQYSPKEIEEIPETFQRLSSLTYNKDGQAL